MVCSWTRNACVGRVLNRKIVLPLELNWRRRHKVFLSRISTHSRKDPGCTKRTCVSKCLDLPIDGIDPITPPTVQKDHWPSPAYTRY